MCGIAGIYSFGPGQSDRAALQSTLQSMGDLLAHRGPDAEGHWIGGPVGFAHRRLSIIDVAGSPQPMPTADGRHVICFNGEILNYRELRARHVLPCRTDGDTEVLLQLLAQRGPEALTELRGQFAFALLDTHTGELLLARDRMGILPLYWTADGARFAFASETKALAPVLGRLEVDATVVAEYLARRAAPAPLTLVRHVAKVLPGHCLRVRPDGTVAQWPYWTLDDVAPPDRKDQLDPAKAVDQLDTLLRQAVAVNMVADVPVGAYLSGGVDSTLITALATRTHTGGRLKTFTAGFGGPDDEREVARQVAGTLGTDHHEVVVEPHSFLDEAQRLAWFRDAPISETSDIAVAALARLAAQHVTVVLSGEGSDELFAGYPKFQVAAASSMLGHIPTALRRPLLSFARRTVGTRNMRLGTALGALQGGDDWERNASWFSPFTAVEIERLTGQKVGGHHRAIALRGDAVRRMGLIDCTSWLSDNLLERGDRMTMSASIELRPPFLDPAVVEFAFGLPSALKLRSRQGKWIVKRVAERYVDPAVVNRRKIGFKVPLGDWLRTDLAEQATALLTGPESHLSDHVDAGLVRAMWEEHRSGARDHTKQLWPLLSLELWWRSMDGDRSHAAAPTVGP